VKGVINQAGPVLFQMKLRLGRYVRRETSLRELRNWLVDSAWDCKFDSAEERLLGEIEWFSAEFYNRRIDESALRERFSRILEVNAT